MNRAPALLFTLASLLLLAPALHGQAEYTATRNTEFQVGVGVNLLRPDYVETNNYGAVIYGTYDFLKIKHIGIGIDAEFKFDGIVSPADIGEDSYLAGPRFNFYHHNRINVYGKVLIGRGVIFNQDNNSSSGYNVFAYGGGVEYRILPKFNLRGDLEEQKWPNFYPNTLSPVTATIGIAYVIK